jgi:hypothetical protein
VGVFLIGGFPLLVWGFFVSTVVLWHGTFTINSLSHVFGSRRYKTTDTSRNNLLLALVTCGEGWHNNHHYHQNTANQGWFWWEVDATFYMLKVLSALGLVWDLRLPSESVKFAFRSTPRGPGDGGEHAGDVRKGPARRDPRPGEGGRGGEGRDRAGRPGAAAGPQASLCAVPAPRSRSRPLPWPPARASPVAHVHLLAD